MSIDNIDLNFFLYSAIFSTRRGFAIKSQIFVNSIKYIDCDIYLKKHIFYNG